MKKLLCALCALYFSIAFGPLVFAGDTNPFVGLKASRLGGVDEDISMSILGGVEHSESPVAVWISYEIHDPLADRKPFPFDSTFHAGIALYKTKYFVGHEVTLYAGPELLRPSGGEASEWAGSMLVGCEMAFDPGWVEISHQWLDPLTDHEVYGELDSIFGITGGLYLGGSGEDEEGS